MLAKIFVVLIMLIILFCLGSGLFYLIRDDGQTINMVKLLTWRIGLSLFLFLLLFLGFALGFITPHGVLP